MKKIGLILSTALLIGVSGCKAKQQNSIQPNISSPTTISEQYLKLDGLKIRYKIEGQEGKPTLVLLHGFTSSLESWDGLVLVLKEKYRIVRFDLPGHGLTGPDPKHRYAHADFVTTVHEVIKELGIDKPTLIGNSMGGNTAWRYATTYPNEIENLVLIDASGFPLGELSDEPIALSPMLESYFLEPSKMAINFGLKNQYANSQKIPKGRAENILNMMKTPGNGEAFVEIYKVFTLPDPTEELAKITVPTLIIWGEKDGVVPLAHANLFDAAINNSHIAVIENTGHVPHEENPHQTAKEIITFLAK